MSTRNDSPIKDQSRYEVVIFARPKMFVHCVRIMLSGMQLNQLLYYPMKVLARAERSLDKLQIRFATTLCQKNGPPMSRRSLYKGYWAEESRPKCPTCRFNRRLFYSLDSRMMQGVLDDLKPELIVADNLYELEGDLFGIDELP
jgi:hypothetical protein